MTGLRDMFIPPETYDTALSPQEEAAFQAWLRKLPARLQSTEDYDMRGAWKANARQAANGHLPDTWKKPNHPTFSDQSIYSRNGRAGGRWASAGGDRFVYWASPENMKRQSMTQLSDYFARNEPGNSVIMPLSYRMMGARK